jgi:hypothetical protein
VKEVKEEEGKKDIEFFESLENEAGRTKEEEGESQR